jgi:Tfp pilus assembly protein PilN
LIRAGADSTPEAVMQKALCTSNISVGDLSVDLLQSTLDKQPVARVAACRKKYISGIVGFLKEFGVNLHRSEPAPCALVRLATLKYRPPRRAKVLLRIFLGVSEGLAAMVADGIPLAWRTFPMKAGSEGFSILSAVRTLITQAKNYCMELPLGYAMIHGRSDIHARLKKEALPSQIGTRVVWNEEPQFTGATMAYGLALGCLNQNLTAFDLSRAMKPRASLREIFPWGELVCEAAIVFFMGLMLTGHSREVDEAYALDRDQCSQNKLVASTKPKDLEQEKKDLTQKIKVIHSFLDSRLLWTAYTRDIASHLPPNILLQSFQGQWPLDTIEKKSSMKKGLTMQAKATLMPDGTAPMEVGDFLVSLRNHPMLKRDFPDISVSIIKLTKASGKNPATADFSIICKPASPDGSKKAAGGDPAKKEAK